MEQKPFSVRLNVRSLNLMMNKRRKLRARFGASPATKGVGWWRVYSVYTHRWVAKEMAAMKVIAGCARWAHEMRINWKKAYSLIYRVRVARSPSRSRSFTLCRLSLRKCEPSSTWLRSFPLCVHLFRRFASFFRFFQYRCVFFRSDVREFHTRTIKEMFRKLRDVHQRIQCTTLK